MVGNSRWDAEERYVRIGEVGNWQTRLIGHDRVIQGAIHFKPVRVREIVSATRGAGSAIMLATHVMTELMCERLIGYRELTLHDTERLLPELHLNFVHLVGQSERSARPLRNHADQYWPDTARAIGARHRAVRSRRRS